ncbi:hypothetical protein EZS27_010075 [termite gut metagenome]|uniref:Uncharacterized protein n=1 Tax=termite gut metagenome TaxID=433724 RepID=A0A5J4S9U9_9ZZZZ
MNSKNNPADISYYSLSLIRFLRESFPELANDNKFIAARSEVAAETYEQAVFNCSNPIEAEEQASVVLFQGLFQARHINNHSMERVCRHHRAGQSQILCHRPVAQM